MIVVIALNLRVMATIVNSVISSCTRSVATSSLNSSSTTHLTPITLSGFKKNEVTIAIYVEVKSRIYHIIATCVNSTSIYTVPSTHHQMLLTILRRTPTSSHLSRRIPCSTVLLNAGRLMDFRTNVKNVM